MSDYTIKKPDLDGEVPLPPWDERREWLRQDEVFVFLLKLYGIRLDPKSLLRWRHRGVTVKDENAEPTGKIFLPAKSVAGTLMIRKTDLVNFIEQHPISCRRPARRRPRPTGQ